MTRQDVINYLIDHYEDIERRARRGSPLARAVMDAWFAMLRGTQTGADVDGAVMRYAADQPDRA